MFIYFLSHSLSMYLEASNDGEAKFVSLVVEPRFFSVSVVQSSFNPLYMLVSLLCQMHHRYVLWPCTTNILVLFYAL